jgi:hypothetical protein
MPLSTTPKKVPIISIPDQPISSYDNMATTRRSLATANPERKPETQEISSDSDMTDCLEVKDTDSDGDYSESNRGKQSSKKKPRRTAGNKSKEQSGELTTRREYGPDKLWIMIHSRDREMLKRDKRILKLTELKNRRGVEVEKKKTHLKDKQFAAKEHQGKSSSLKDELKNLKSEYDKVKADLRDATREIEGLKGDTLAKTKRGDLPVEDDTAVANRLTPLFRDTKAVAKQFGMESWREVPSEARNKALNSVIYGRHPRLASHRVLPAMEFGLISVKQLVNALLNRQLFSRFFVQILEFVESCTAWKNNKKLYESLKQSKWFYK